MIDKHDPRLTDYVLGELDEQETARIEAAIQASDELKHAVAEIQQAKIWLNAAFESEPDLSLSPEQRASILESARRPGGGGATPVSIFSKPSISRRWQALATVAALMGFLVGGALYFNRPGSDDRANSVALNDDRDSQELADSADLAMAPAEDQATPEPVNKLGAPNLKGVVNGGDLETARLRRAAAGDFEAESMTEKGSSTSQLGDLNQATAVPQLAGNNQQPTPAAAPGQAAESAKEGSPSVQRDDTALLAMEAALEQPQLAADENLYSNASPLTERSLQEHATAQVVQRTRELLDQSELRLLNLQVTTRKQVVEAPLNYEITAFQQQQRLHLVTPQEQGDQPLKQTQLVDQLVDQQVRQRVEVTIKHQIIEPEVSIATEDARALVDRLASAVDPDQTQVLTLENLLALENPIDWGGGSSPSVGQPKLESSHAVGGFSSKEQVTKPLDRASFRFVQTLNSFIDSRTLDEGDGSIVKQPTETDTIVLENQFGQAGEPELADADRQAEGSPAPNQPTADNPDPSTAEMRVSQTRQTATVVPIPMLPQSIDQLDFSPMIKTLHRALQERNEDVKERQQNPNK